MMKTLLSRQDISDNGTFNVYLAGGSPWGFTLHGGREFNSKLCISKITPGGKADKCKVLQVGDEVVAINNMECSTRAEAIEQVRCSRESLNLAIKRDIVKHNGIHGRNKKYYPLPNLYKTALEVAVEPNDFYKTYSVDPMMYKQIELHSKYHGTNWKGHEDSELSASNEDLLESYRNQESMVGSDEALDKGTKSGVANGRLSPQTKSGYNLTDNQKDKHTYTSPDNIMKVKIRCANIISSTSTFSSPEDEGKQQSRISPDKHSPVSRQHHVIESEVKSSKPQDNWVEQWLRNEQQSISPEENVSVKNVRTKFEENKTNPNVYSSQAQNKSNFSRSKSFSGRSSRPSYGVVIGTTAVKDKDHSQITAFQAPLPPIRYSSSDLLKDKAHSSHAAADGWQSTSIQLPIDTESFPRRVTTIQEEKNQQVEVRPYRKSLGSISMVSLDAVGSSESRRLGPAPPPRRSESKLLSSFRFRRKGLHPHTVSSGTTREPLRSSPRKENPKHVSSKSWPSDHLGNQYQALPGKETIRQSWHSEKPKNDGNPEEKSQEEQPKTGPAGLKCSSSVVIRSIRTSLSSLTQEDNSSKSKIYRSSSVELQPQVATFEAMRSQSARDRDQPQQQTQQTKAWNLQHEVRSLSNRIEDTQILQRLMKDKEASNNLPSVKSRIQNFEKSSSQPNLLEEPEMVQWSNHPKQRSWDHAYTQSNQKSPHKVEPWAHERMPSPENSVYASTDEATSKQREHVSFISNEEAGAAPIKVTSMVKELEKSESLLRVVQPARLIYDAPDVHEKRTPDGSKIKKESFPVKEEITRIQSTSQQEREIFMDEMFKKLEDDNKTSTPSDKLDQSNNNIVIHEHSGKAPRFSVGEDEVFSGSEDDLPPPPPSLNLETPHASSPCLPSPPGELLVQESPRNIIEVKAIEHAIQKPETPRWSEIIYAEKDEDTRSRYSEDKSDKNKSISEELSVEPKEKENIEEEVEAVKEKNTKNYELRLEKESPSEYAFIKNESSPSDNDSNLYENNYMPTDKSTELSKSDYQNTTKSPPPPPLEITSTPTSPSPLVDESSSPDNEQASNTSPLSGSSLSTPSSSRPGSMMSPKLEALDKEKGVLIESMRKKIEDLKTQMNEISEEIIENEKLGEKVATLLEGKTTPYELSKYQRFTGELNKIVLLLLSLTQRMHRYENTLQELDMSEEADRHQRDILLDKIEHVKAQYQEACKIKEVNDKRGEVVSIFLENYLNEDEFADFQYYIDMKTQLALMHAEIRDKVKMGEERLNALTTTSIDWNVLSLSNY